MSEEEQGNLSYVRWLSALFSLFVDDFSRWFHVNCS